MAFSQSNPEESNRVLLRIYDDLDEARRTVLRRRPPEDTVLPTRVSDRVREVFGEDLDAGAVVDRIVRAVRDGGDAAVRRFGIAFDGQTFDSFEVPRDEIEGAWRDLPGATRDAMELAASRIRRFHERAMPRTWLDFDGDSTFGQVFRALDRVGLYAPGGRGAYPSTVLMTAIPARVAGVREVVLCTPPGPDGLPHRPTLAAARAAGVDRVFRVGGAQAVAAMAYGSESIPRVDKIVGPGNLFVALAKRQVFGAVGIDQLAGPTETLLIADDSASPAAIAADLLAQAEHDPMATALLITNSAGVARATADEVERQIGLLDRREIVAESLRANGGAIVAPDIQTAIELANDFAPEHLCLILRDAWSYLPRIRNAGGIFIGERSIEAIGDYTAGPSHVMPTGGTARFASPLGVLDFLKVSSIFDVAPGTFAEIGPAAVALAEAEKLGGHASAIRLRLGGERFGQ
jgi:histidinol dehydrogenase